MKRLILLLTPVFLAVMAAAQEVATARLAGRVTDPTGAPVPDVSIIINRTSGARLEGGLPKVLTDAEGRYSLEFHFLKGRTLSVHEVFAEGKGWARAAPPVAFRFQGGENELLPVVIQRGEVLAGVVTVPLTELEQLSEPNPVRRQRMLELSGPSVNQLSENARVYFTEADGSFDIRVPTGEYAISLLGHSTPPVRWDGIKSGRRDIVLDLPEFVWSENTLGPLFDRLWEEMDRRYSYFYLKKEVDWAEYKTRFRPRAIAARNSKELTEVLQAMLEPLHDLHIKIETPEGTIPTYLSPWTYNGNFKFTLDQVEAAVECGKFAVVGRTKGDGFGCFIMTRQSAATPGVVQQAVAAIKGLADTSGFIVDLRRANGGSEPLALEIAQLFCAEETVYAKSKYRNGPSHGDFTKEMDRRLPASPGAYTRPVVCLIGGGAVSSGEGFVKMLKCLPHVTLVGQPTRGASGNPKPVALARTGLSVLFSRWVDLMPDGQTFEGVGIAPDVEVNEPANTYVARDPTWEKGLEVLRGKVARAK